MFLLALSTVGCGSAKPGGISSSDRLSQDSRGGAAAYRRGADAARALLAHGTLLIKEYPPLPYPAGYTEYIALLKARCGVKYEVPSLPQGADDAEFRREVGGWDDVMEAAIEQKFGKGTLARLQAEGRRKHQASINAK